MDLIATKQFSSPMCGNKSAGDPIDVSDAFGRQLIEWGMAEQVNVIKKNQPTNGSGEQSPSLPVGQASPKSNVITSESLVGRRSQSTPVTDSPPGVMSSTDATEHGGAKTTTASPKKRRNGRKTKTHTSD